MSQSRFFSLRSFARRGLWAVALASCPTWVVAQESGAAAFRDLAEIKAECQRVSKLVLEKSVGLDSARVQRRMRRAVSELTEYAQKAGTWSRAGVPAEGSQKIATDIRALVGIAATETPNRATALEALTIADRCTTDAEAALKDVKNVGTGSRALSHVAKVLFLSQRTVRDYMALSSKLALPANRAAQNKIEIEELTTSLNELAKFPSTPAMLSALAAVRQQWTILRPQLAQTAATPEQLQLVVRGSEVMFDAVDDLFDEVAKAARAFN